MQTNAVSLPWYRFLDRPRLPAAEAAMLETLRGESILITGAGGSIGSSLALHLASLKPRALVLFEASENNLYEVETNLRNAGLAHTAASYLGSLSDEGLLNEVFFLHRPSLIFHAAACKHVPLLEAQPLAALSNNVLGTLALSKRASAAGSRLVLLSTDKAVAPASVMGATKRLAECIVLAHGGTAVRLGNVLGSRGSVVDTFLRQIQSGEALTVTHPEARRYFLTLEESVQLLLLAALESSAAALRRETEPQLFAANLDRSYLVRDLARFMVRELTQDREASLTFTGLQSGEKLVEALWAEDEVASAASQYGLRLIHTPLPLRAQLESGLEVLRNAVARRDVAAGVAILERIVSGYSPSERLLAAIHPSTEKARV